MREKEELGKVNEACKNNSKPFSKKFFVEFAALALIVHALIIINILTFNIPTSLIFYFLSFRTNICIMCLLITDFKN